MAATKERISDDAGVPRHIAIIMDGNGRWAGQRSLPRQAGHKAGIGPVRMTVEQCVQHGVRALTLFAFSSENFERPPEEVQGLMTLFVEALAREVDELDTNNVRLRFIGDRQVLCRQLHEATITAEERTAGNTALELVVAVAYGGRWDAARAARRLAAKVKAGELEPAQIDEAVFAAELDTAALPDVDLLVRTGGEKRVSNFLLWDLAYSEFYFTDILWPDFTEAEFANALEFYARRQRRFGRTGEQVEALSC